MSRGLQIGQVARETGLTVDAIRFYEKQRLLQHPSRTDGGFRLFAARDVENIRFIRRAQKLGFSLNEIRELLVLRSEDLAACSHVRDLLKTKLGTVREKIAELQKLEGQLSADLRKCERALQRGNPASHKCCPVLEEISAASDVRAGRQRMRVEILYFEGCPNHQPTSERVRTVIRDEGLLADVNEIEVPDETAAKTLRFLGSPTIRVNGVDIEPELRGAEGGSFACRRYPGGVPPTEMIRAALHEARERKE